MPLGKDDAPANAGNVKEAKAELFDSGAGAPAEQRQAAEDLPENDAVQKGIKEGMLATDAQSEVKAKVKVVDDSSTGAEETPSGFALKKVAGIADDTKRAEEYTRIKNAVRTGNVPADPKDLP